MGEHKRRLYYKISTGEIVLDVGAMMGSVPPQPSIQEEMEVFGYSPEEIDCLELEWGQYWEELASGNPHKINPVNKRIKSYKRMDYQSLYYNDQSVKKTYTEKEVYKFYYEHYVNYNLKQLLLSGDPRFSFKWYSLDELNIRYSILNKSWHYYFRDGYLKECAKERTMLAEDIVANGTYWPLKVARDPKDGLLYVHEGNHRILSAKLLQLAGKWDNNFKWLCIEFNGDLQSFKHPEKLDDPEFDLVKPIRQRMPFVVKFGCDASPDDPVVIEEMESRNGIFVDEDTIEIDNDTYYEILSTMEVYPHWLRDIFYGFKLKGRIIRPCPVLNSKEEWDKWATT